MKIKLNKIVIIIIFVLLSLILLGNTANATVTIDGEKYYAKGDVIWHANKDDKSGYIEITNDGAEGFYYCRKHGAGLTKFLGDVENLQKNESLGDWYESMSGAEEEIHKKEEEALKDTIWSGAKCNTPSKIYRALKLKMGSWIELNEDYSNPVNLVKSRTQMALYAFANKYYEDYNKSSYVQRAVWQYIREYENDTFKTEGETKLYEAAKYYATDWIANNKADVKGTKEAAKVRIIGKDYIIGPFNIEYIEAVYDDINFSWLDKYSLTDQNGNKIAATEITDQYGKKIFGIAANGDKIDIPNGEDFYVKFPYSDTITQLNVKEEIKYIDSVTAKKQDVETQAYDFRFKWTESTSQGSSIHHTANCSGGERWEHGVNNAFCSSCNAGATMVYKYEASGAVKCVGESSNEYQDMRRFEGDVIYNISPITLSVPIVPPGGTEPPPGDDPPPGGDPDEMDLAGYVWEDMPEGKDQTVNGLKDNNDVSLAGIEVRLYDKTTGKLANVYRSSNPVVTNSEGRYIFKGLDPTHKYFVVFVYDGMLYTNTYGAGVPEYNTEGPPGTEKWNNTSKGSELVSGRNALNEKFRTISSYPASYRTTAIFGDPQTYLSQDSNGNWYNRVYSVNEIQDKEGIIQRYKNAVADQIRGLKAKQKLGESQDYFNAIYWPIIRSSSNQTEAKQVLQYIWDCRIKAYAGNQSIRDGITDLNSIQLYPIYDKFVLTDEQGNRITAKDAKTTYNGYRIIYNGQLHINLGLIKRPTTDLELTKDLYRAVVSINGQDETYNFGTFDRKGVKINATDANAHVTQNVATADYNYAEYARENLTGTSGILSGEASYPEGYAPIQMYITYRINVKNNSSMPTSVNEIVSYIDTNYYSYSNTYKTTGGKTLTGITGSFLYPSKSDSSGVTEREEKALKDYYGENIGIKVNEHSKYGTASETGGDLGIGKELFISFDNDIILENNQMIAVYITYRLGENSTTHSKFNCTYKNENRPEDGNHAYLILQDALEKGNANKKITVYTRAEINAYSTFFRREADPESTRDKYKYDYTSPVNSGQNYRAAGVYDAVSMPGNLDKEQLRIFNEENNKKTEDDWDRASAFVIVDPNATRTIEGNVWETVGKPANEWRDNELYPEFEHSYGAKDITAELVEIKKVKENGTEYVKEFVRAKTKTDENGYYKFTEYIPGQYVVRFIYGDTANYDTKEQYSPYTEFELNEYKVKSAYNGQFYQSGKANPNTNLNDINHKNYNQYWYANETDTRYSDAYDEVNRRMEVNELLKTYKYSDILSLLKHPTDYMVYAYTSLLDVEVEYAKEETNGQDPAYTIRNIDFALTPRTEAKLDIKKEVKRIKLVLQNGTVQFDADTETIRRQGVPAVLQAAQGHDINISMSSELVNGATLEITYEITIENVSPLDTITYYKNQDEKIIALGFYEEDPTKIIYYENDKMRTYENKVATENNTKVLLFSRPEQTTWTSMIISGITNKEQLDPNRNERIVTTTGANEVADYISKNLNFTKQSYTGEEINKAWDLVTVSKDDFDKEYYRQKQDDDVEESLKPIIGEASQKSEDRIANLLEMDASEVYDSNTIVISNSQNGLIKDLEPRGTASEEIVLSKVISVNDSSTDTKSYNNNVRIIRINNSVSRIQNMAATNLKYTSEKVIVSDPTGIGNKYLPIILTLVVVTIIGSGIILVKKFVINK